METQAALKRTGFESQGRHNLFSIKPYKNNLLTPGANYWIICIHLVILVMATSEAIAWGYLGSLFGKGALGVIAAAITFLFMFLIIWVIDVSFVTLDLSRSYYDKIILKKESERWVDNTRLGVGLLGRVTIVFVSLSISAPFLAQIVFKQDIDNEIDRRNMATVSMISDSMLIAKDEEIASLDSMILAREAELVTETAGKGSSGNYGFGPVTQAMERNIQRLRDERTTILQDKNVLDQTAQSLTVPEFASLYNVDLIDNGVRTREEILGGLMENPEYRTAKTAITAFLAFIFAALVLLKLFQPRSVRIYYNEKLQDLYREYLAGHLNKWIAVPEQSIEGQSQMSPLRFEDWCVSTYSVVRNEDIKRRDSRKIYNLFKMKIEQLEEEKAEIKKMMEPVESEFEQAMTEVNQIKIELLDVENQLSQNLRNGEEIAVQLDRVSDDLLHHRFQGSDVLIAVSAKKDAEAQMAANKNERLALQYKSDLIRHKHDVKDADATQVESSMSKIRMYYRDLQEKIDRERVAYTDLVVSGLVVDIPKRPVFDDQEIPAVSVPDFAALPEQKDPTALPEASIVPALEISALEALRLSEDLKPESLDHPLMDEEAEEEVNPVDNLLSDRTSENTLADILNEDLNETLEDPDEQEAPGEESEEILERAAMEEISEEPDTQLPWEDEEADDQVDLMYDDDYNHAYTDLPESTEYSDVEQLGLFNHEEPEASSAEDEQQDHVLEEEATSASDTSPDELNVSEDEVVMYWDNEEDYDDNPADDFEDINDNDEETIEWKQDVAPVEEAPVDGILQGDDLLPADTLEDMEEDITDEETLDVDESAPEAPAKEEESPLEFVDDQQLNAYAEAVSMANYEDEALQEAQDEEDDAKADYFVDPALIAYNSYDPIGIDILLNDVEEADDRESESIESFNENVQSFLEEETDPVDDDVYAEDTDALATAVLETDDLDVEDLEMDQSEATADVRSEETVDESDDEALQEDLKSFLSEDGEELDEDMLQKIANRANRADRNGRHIRKGAFGKTFGKGV